MQNNWHKLGVNKSKLLLLLKLTYRMPLKNKTILIISPQAWGHMYLSKHHYAITLAKLGNTVYFLNPPELENAKQAGEIEISTSYTHHNLFLINHRLRFPFLLKFHAISFFHWLMGFHIKRIMKKIGKPVDIIWSFDQQNLYPYKFFGNKPFKIFHPVDEPSNKQALKAAKGSQLILSVTSEILEKYKVFQQPGHLINHGVGDDFLSVARNNPDKKNIHVGLSGNLLREDIDRETLLKIIDQNPSVIFEYWGPYSLVNNNIGGSRTDATKTFISLLQQRGVIFHGPANPAQLARELQRMNAFLICYDVKKDQSRGTNYHKIMEYVSTGKVIISNNITAYLDKPALVQMIRSRDNNRALTHLFKNVIQNLDYHNSPALEKLRKEYANQNTYSKQISRIEKIIDPMTADLKEATQDLSAYPSPSYY
jgi:hypothetical protein